MTRMLIAFARGCYHGLCRSTTAHFRFGTPLENVDSLSSSPHGKLPDTPVQSSSFSLRLKTNLKVEL